MQAKYNELKHDLKSTISKAHLIDDPLQTLAIGTDASFYRLTPKLIVRAQNESQVKTIMDRCRRYSLPFTFRAAGTSVCGQAQSDSVLIKLVDSWKHCQVHDDGHLITLGVLATGAQANAALKPFGRKLGPDPASLQIATIGGMVMNNSAGMQCTVETNCQRTLKNLKMMLIDGTTLDGEDAESRSRFREVRPDIVSGVSDLMAKVQGNTALRDFMGRKYALRNTCGYSLDALIAYDDPIDVIQHLMVGSEGTLAFVSEATIATVHKSTFKATALISFHTVKDAASALPILRKCNANSAELFDRRTIAALETTNGIPEFFRSLGSDAAVLLVELGGKTRKELSHKVSTAQMALADLPLVQPVEFIFDAQKAETLWEIRDQIHTIMGNLAPPGTVMVSEDFAIPIDNLAEIIPALHKLFDRFGYNEGMIMGHALAGNLHFVMFEDFSQPRIARKYANFIEEFVELVAVRFKGSLKAEHGTGRSVAPFVSREWGNEAYKIMKRIKHLFDPENLMNPDVIITEKNDLHIQGLKTVTAVDPIIDKCSECGFCESACVTNDFTLSARQRVVILREMKRLRQIGDNKRTAELAKDFRWYVLDTCATDSLCAHICPSQVDVGQMVKKLRSKKTTAGANRIADKIARHIKPITTIGRGLLASAATIRSVIPPNLLKSSSEVLRRFTFNHSPIWLHHTPIPQTSFPYRNGIGRADNKKRIVWFPSCINRTMGPDPAKPESDPLPEVILRLSDKAGYQVLFPRDTDKLCCGLAFASKGLESAAEQCHRELVSALMDISHSGRLSILCEMSPCLLHMQETLPATLRLYEPVSFAMEFIVPHLEITPLSHSIVVHPVCSLKKLGLEDDLIALAKMCARQVVTTQTNCCGFAGDRGFMIPELNNYGLRDMLTKIPPNTVGGYSTSRTCEVGLSEKTGMAFQSIFHLLDQCSRPK